MNAVHVRKTIIPLALGTTCMYDDHDGSIGRRHAQGIVKYMPWSGSLMIGLESKFHFDVDPTTEGTGG